MSTDCDLPTLPRLVDHQAQQGVQQGDGQHRYHHQRQQRAKQRRQRARSGDALRILEALTCRGQETPSAKL